jgi:hypothetical protein
VAEQNFDLGDVRHATSEIAGYWAWQNRDRLRDAYHWLSELPRDPEKWAPVFGKDHAQTKSWSGMMTRLKIIPL